MKDKAQSKWGCIKVFVCVCACGCRGEGKVCMCSFCMHVRAYVSFVRVLNQYLHSACQLSWVSQFGRMFFFSCVNDVCKGIYSICTVCM